MEALAKIIQAVFEEGCAVQGKVYLDSCSESRNSRRPVLRGSKYARRARGQVAHPACGINDD